MKLSESFTIQQDQSADVKLAVVFAFVRHVYKDKFKEDLLFCKLSEAQATDQYIIWILDQLFYRPSNWLEKCINFFTDSANSMMGQNCNCCAS